MSSEAFFLPDGSGGQRFALLHAEVERPRALVLFIHPFAEELNKSRRMAALQSRALAKAGLAVLQFDLLGCGDSSGDFSDASWQAWIDDVVRAARWLRERYPLTDTLSVWGLRAGCLLAAQAAPMLAPVNLVFWQPAPQGKSILQQFLRLKLAGEILGGTATATAEKLRKDLAEGLAVEVAGYPLPAAVANGLGSATLGPLADGKPLDSGCTLEWFEINSKIAAGELSVAAQQGAQAWVAAGWNVRTHLIPGPPFWQTAEIAEAPALVDATVSALTAHEHRLSPTEAL